MTETAAQPPVPKPVILCILDGWGHRTSCENNAICEGPTPNLDRMLEELPHALVDASEGEVGLPRGQMGNSEVGHMNLGAGRVVMQDLPRIDAAVADGSFARMQPLQDAIAALKQSGGTAHVMGLMSPGGVHSHQNQIAALSEVLAGAGIPVAVHAFLDGRDTPPRSALDFLKAFQAKAPNARIATVSGRYYAMDRDKRWARVEKAYCTLVQGEGEHAGDALKAIEQSYAAETSDEFVLPTVIADYKGMADGDGLFMANFRADRAREILTALLDPAFDGFQRGRQASFACALGMVEYSTQLNAFLATLFPPEDLAETLGEIVSEHGKRQLRIAETEKYAHVTFFFNGGREDVFDGEERILVPSPDVATYDLQPEMSAPEVTDKLVEAIGSGRFDLVVVNYANGDMVGHTGDLVAAMKAVACVDTCVGRLAEAVEKAGGCILLTADHGNAEQMTDESTGQAHTAHTMNKVPLLLINGPQQVTGLSEGRLADIAPTILDLMNLPRPAAMTGNSLLKTKSALGEAAAE
ncbi:2,3-bisphosphoglycerate-independent phosphoglycerate mutase [Pelagibius litoralis]|uniref:2,3-bisphosphoglycerate-independent phosphoglycerate mutase n=1 Tax=Pelagibius litoralis TaxID=374515 RepID=A0A967C438_9PROT|nr:2,3-bisphosphoglycerate-independent phosphoglycerate mutase [Pelagibius litoralis]NIA68290.1 2,3-bisphosphoglycerate-independent phosphoglycerate mutase [Pelagibius litoralis]